MSMKYRYNQWLYVLTIRSRTHQTLSRPSSGGRKRVTTLVFFTHIICPVVLNENPYVFIHCETKTKRSSSYNIYREVKMYKTIHLQVNTSKCSHFFFYSMLLEFNVNVEFDVHYKHFSVCMTQWFDFIMLCFVISPMTIMF